MNLKKIRLDNNLLQKDLAKKVNKTITTICDWERGRTQPSIEDLIKLADCLKCSIDYLIGRENEEGQIIINEVEIDSHSPYNNIKDNCPICKTYKILDYGKRVLLDKYAQALEIAQIEEDKQLKKTKA